MVNAASLASETPAVYVVEDAHWIDEVSESMLADFLTVVPQTRLLTLVTYRPEYRGALAQVPGAQTIALAPLSDPETATRPVELLSARAGMCSTPNGCRSTGRRSGEYQTPPVPYGNTLLKNVPRREARKMPELYWSIVRNNYQRGVPPGHPVDDAMYTVDDWGSQGWKYERASNKGLGPFPIGQFDGWAATEDEAKAKCQEDWDQLSRFLAWFDYMANHEPPA
jgi:hypothetical protein